MATLPPTGLGQWKEEVTTNQGLDAAWSVYWFNETVQRLIHLLKYEGHRRVGRQLATAMYERLGDELNWDSFDLFVPVPLHRTRRRERHYNQAEVLARVLGRLCHRPVEERLVVRQRWTRSQTGLSVEERRANVAGSFRASRAGEGQRVLLVDDVLTTGATASACALALKAAGSRIVTVLTVATPPR